MIAPVQPNAEPAVAGPESGLLYDADGHDRTGLLLDLAQRLDRMAGEVVRLSDRVKSLERLAAYDEVKLAAEIESLRAR